MTDEEMEITIDLAQPGFVEDIDIDLDFAQPDEDMELADFDQAQDMQNFNSDGRDELMAEGDDESFGMVDAEDIIHNETAAAANDIEIDIGGADDGLIPEVAAYEGAPHDVDEIDFAEDIGTEAQNLDPGDWFQTADQVSGSVDETQVNTLGVEETQVNSLGDPTIGAADDTESGLEATTLPAEISPQGPTVEAEQNDGLIPEGVPLQVIPSEENVELGESGTSHGAEHSANFAELDKTLSNGKHDGEHDAPPSSEGQAGEQVNVPEPTQQVQLDGKAVGTEANPPACVSHEEPLPAEGDYSTADLNVVDGNLGDESYNEPLDDENYVNEENGEDEEDGEDGYPTNHVVQSEAGTRDQYANVSQEDSGEDEKQGSRGLPARHSSPVAVRHEMYISYGQTDYKLFAKSEDDDPNHYFLKDTSALELTLAEFLSSLRDVISEEVSPLDELVMHIDGLGLEFAESTTSAFLEKFTFGNILKLYDDLVKNDEAETPPDLYCYLIVRPNCSQRLMALFDSAKSGRGLSEIAVYRETTPFDEAHGSGADSPALSASLDDEAADTTTHEYDEHDEADPEKKDTDGEDTHTRDNHIQENRAADETARLGDDFESNSIGAVDVPELESTKTTENSTENSAREDQEATSQIPEDDLLDFLDEELDLSSSKQGKHPLPPSSLLWFPCNGTGECQCEDCFQAGLERLEASWRLDSVPNTGISASSAQTDLAKSFEVLTPGKGAGHYPTPGSSGYNPTTLPNYRLFKNSEVCADNYSYQDRAVDVTSKTQHASPDEDPNDYNEAGIRPAGGHTPPATSLNGPTDAPNSDNTSVTATLNGDQDEIDYSDDDDDDDDVAGIEDAGDEAAAEEAPIPVVLKVSTDEEITWESENEEGNDETPASASKGTVQVSSPHGKRARTESDDEDGEGEHIDVKRRRS